MWTIVAFCAICCIIGYLKRDKYNYPVEDMRDYQFRSETLLNRRKRVERLMQQSVSDQNLLKQMQAYYLMNTLDYQISHLYKPNPFIHDLHTHFN